MSIGVEFAGLDENRRPGEGIEGVDADDSRCASQYKQ